MHKSQASSISILTCYNFFPSSNDKENWKHCFSFLKGIHISSQYSNIQKMYDKISTLHCIVHMWYTVHSKVTYMLKKAYTSYDMKSTVLVICTDSSLAVPPL